MNDSTVDVTTTCRDISELTPTAQRACKLFLERCKQAGYDIFITETYRSRERQDYLYSIGRTRPGNKVTWTRNSRHTSRRAWDIACKGGELYNAAVLAGCGKIAAQLGITWGGTWKTSPDTPHFEISENWNYSEEDEPMTDAERAKMNDIDGSLSNAYRILEDLKSQIMTLKQTRKRYNTVESVPEWARQTVYKLMERGFLQGDENGNLSLTDEILRILVINDRAGLYDQRGCECHG